MDMQKAHELVHAGENSSIAADNSENDSAMNDYFEHVKGILKDADHHLTVGWISITTAIFLLFVILFFYCVCKRYIAEFLNYPKAF